MGRVRVGGWFGWVVFPYVFPGVPPHWWAIGPSASGSGMGSKMNVEVIVLRLSTCTTTAYSPWGHTTSITCNFSPTSLLDDSSQRAYCLYRLGVGPGHSLELIFPQQKPGLYSPWDGMAEQLDQDVCVAHPFSFYGPLLPSWISIRESKRRPLSRD